ncbi:Phage tail sheath protein [compost metagenome]
MRTLYYFRQACRDRIRLRFPRSKLSSRTAAAVRSELLDVAKKCEELEILEQVDANANALIVERSQQDVNRLNASIPADVVNGLHVFAGRIDLLL